MLRYDEAFNKGKGMAISRSTDPVQALGWVVVRRQLHRQREGLAKVTQ